MADKGGRKAYTLSQWKLPEESLVFVNGASNQGKSYMIKHLIYERVKEDTVRWVFIFSSTIFTGAYDYVPRCWTSETFNPEILEKLLTLQKNALKKNDKLRENGQKEKNINAIIVFDDSIGLDQMSFDIPIMKRLMTTYRHMKLSVIISNQYIKAVPTILRQNISHCMLFPSEFRVNVESAFDAIATNYFDNYKSFMKFFKQCTERPFHCLLYIKDRDQSFSKRFFVYVAPKNIPDFLFEC